MSWDQWDTGNQQVSPNLEMGFYPFIPYPMAALIFTSPPYFTEFYTHFPRWEHCSTLLIPLLHILSD